ncbi:MAG TPA: hypothetical protein VMZ28_26295 [Kofleriaceae bacterium]|nr:hypothetical protein [Kofleriaceae bacterium]
MHCSFCGGLFRWERGRCPIDGTWLAPGDDPMIGRALGQTPAYLIERVHADGEVGRVYLARAPEGAVHVEVLYGDLAVEPVFYESFVRSAARGRDVGTTSTGLPFAVTPATRRAHPGRAVPGDCGVRRARRRHRPCAR